MLESMEAEGHFEKRGVNVEFVSCIGGHRCVRNMLAGETELSTATELPVVFNSFTRNDFAILTSFVSVSTNTTIAVNFWSVTGRQVTKSIDIAPHFRLGRSIGCSNPYGR